MITINENVINAINAVNVMNVMNVLNMTNAISIHVVVKEDTGGLLVRLVQLELLEELVRLA
ncbi:hypothetical protein AZE41_17855 [Sporosarcina psychrophila]|nr:hypothetical protein AZE41_17855 [Sporosarcina psychrophila]